MKVAISAPARRDILTIHDYLTAQAGREKARQLAAEIREKCIGLEKMPDRFQLLAGFEGTGLRRRIYRDYLIVYQVRANAVIVIRVLHGASDYETLLRDLKAAP